MSIFEILTIGNELLNGKTQNTNAYWLAKKITRLGGLVIRCTTIRDEIEDINFTIKEAIVRKVNWIIISGGLGPTYDDKTLQSVAKSLNRELVLDKKALKMVQNKYKEFLNRDKQNSFELTPARRKMATLPKGAKPLPNQIGTAPGVLIKEKKVTLVCLPGVPSEMKSIFEKSIRPIIEKTVKKFYREKSIKFSGILESELAPIIEEVLKNNPLVYIKSHPKGHEEGVSKIEIQIIAIANKEILALEKIQLALDEIKSRIIQYGSKEFI